MNQICQIVQHQMEKVKKDQSLETKNAQHFNYNNFIMFNL